ncbi:MAG: PP2C family protein-serine/threonine phosphatase [Ilumatobacteraceae bacterium]
MSAVRGRKRLPAIIMAVGLVIFFALAAGCRVLYDQTEGRLLEQRTSEAGATLQLGVTQIELSLGAAAKLSEATNGDGAAFKKMIETYVGDAKTFTSAALFRIGSTTPVVQVGPASGIPVDGANSVSTILDAVKSQPFVVVDLLGGDQRQLAYAVPNDSKNPQFVAFAERLLSQDPNVQRRTDEPFAQLDYAIYMGDTPAEGHLLGASVRDLPLKGRTAEHVIPFGNSNLVLVMQPIGHLSGDLFAHLWWIVALGGALFSSAFAFLTSRLLKRRDTALALASDNARLYDEQRHIAETLQLGLLPQHLAAPTGVAVAARYWPAGSANLIGGDFYDLFAVDDDRWALAIGDVCGKGIEAAALTGLARHTLRAAARNASTPVAVLQAVHHALRDHLPATFCTACFAYLSRLDDDSYRVELTLGGHPPPLLRRRNGEVEPIGELGMLLGMIEPTLTTTVVDLSPGDTLVFYTDGLTDAPAQEAVSVEELAALLETKGDQSIEQLADSIRALKRGRRPQGSSDDTALLIVRFEGSLANASTGAAAADEPAQAGRR